jgi:hypothetical protein
MMFLRQSHLFKDVIPAFAGMTPWVGWMAA